MSRQTKKTKLNWILVARSRTLRKSKNKSNFKIMLKENKISSGKPWNQAIKVLLFKRLTLIKKVLTIKLHKRKEVFNLAEVNLHLPNLSTWVIRESSQN